MRLEYCSVPVVSRIVQVKEYKGLDELDRKLSFGFGHSKPVPDNIAILMSPKDRKKFENDLQPKKGVRYESN